jgi:hypothetical protein
MKSRSLGFRKTKSRPLPAEKMQPKKEGQTMKIWTFGLLLRLLLKIPLALKYSRKQDFFKENI